jgi:hypothetical protein
MLATNSNPKATLDSETIGPGKFQKNVTKMTLTGVPLSLMSNATTSILAATNNHQPLLRQYRKENQRHTHPTKEQ